MASMREPFTDQTMRFFSPKGRSPIARFVLVTVAAGFVLYLASMIAWDRGYIVNAVLGGVGGVAVAKLLVEASRRLHDAGFGRRFGGVFALLLGIAFAALAMLVDVLSPQAVTIGLYLVAAAAVLPLLIPGQRRANEFGVPPRSWIASPPPAGEASHGRLYLPFALMLAGAAFGVGITWLGTGMDRSNHRSIEEAAARERTDDSPKDNNADPFFE